MDAICKQQINNDNVTSWFQVEQDESLPDSIISAYRENYEAGELSVLFPKDNRKQFVCQSTFLSFVILAPWREGLTSV